MKHDIIGTPIKPGTVTKAVPKEPSVPKQELKLTPTIRNVLKELSMLKVELTFHNRNLSCATSAALTPEVRKVIEQHEPLLIAEILLRTKSRDIEDWFVAVDACATHAHASDLMDCFYQASWSSAELAQMSRAYIQRLEHLQRIGHREFSDSGLRLQYELADKIRLEYEKHRLAKHLHK